MKKKQEVITFKVNMALYERIKEIPNRSEFIRKAILKELGTVCPLCGGTGMLDSAQKSHWDTFAVNHPLTRCEHCNSLILSCSHS
jgi:hypothetical protein